MLIKNKEYWKSLTRNRNPIRILWLIFSCKCRRNGTGYISWEGNYKWSNIWNKMEKTNFIISGHLSPWNCCLFWNCFLRQLHILLKCYFSLKRIFFFHFTNSFPPKQQDQDSSLNLLLDPQERQSKNPNAWVAFSRAAGALSMFHVYRSCGWFSAFSNHMRSANIIIKHIF